MGRSIATESWQVNAEDPLALTYLLDLPEFTVTSLEYAAPLDLLLVGCQPCYDVAVCPTCDTVSAHLHDRKERLVRDVPWAGKPCALVIPARRFKCARCRRPFTEQHAAIAPQARYTQRYEHFSSRSVATPRSRRSTAAKGWATKPWKGSSIGWQRASTGHLCPAPCDAWALMRLP